VLLHYGMQWYIASHWLGNLVKPNIRTAKVSFLLTGKTSEYYTTETSVIYCWGDELILSHVRMWLTPQLYRYWCFGCRFSKCRGWPHYFVFGVLRLRHITGVIAVWTWTSHFGSLLLLARVLRDTCIFVELVFWYVIKSNMF
jgi:hypothetical protein